MSARTLLLVSLVLAAGCAAQRAQNRFDNGGSYVPTLVEDLPPPDSSAYPKELGAMPVPKEDVDEAKEKTTVLCDSQRGIKDGATGDWGTMLKVLSLDADNPKLGDFPITGWKLKALTIRCDQFAINDVAIKPDVVIGAGNFRGASGAVMIAATVFAMNYSTGDVMMTSFAGKITGLGPGQGKVEKSYVSAGNIKRYLADKRFASTAIFAPNVFSGTLPAIAEVFLVTDPATQDGLWIGARQGTDYFNLAKLTKG